MQNHLKDELHHVLSGKSKVRFGNLIQAIACYLNDGEKTSPAIEVKKHFKEQETKRLELYISQHNLWIDTIDFSQYVSEGAEQKVYLKDSEHVLKLNDSIYYTSWKDYLYNLLLHNYFFRILRIICLVLQKMVRHCMPLCNKITFPLLRLQT